MIEQLNAIADLWWNWVAAMFWQVGLLIVLIACVDRLTRRWTWPQLRYALWSLVLIKLVLPPTLSLPSSVTPRLLPVVAETLSVDRGMGNPLAHVDPGDNGGETAWASELPILPLSTEDVTPHAVVYAPPSQPAIEPAGPALDWRVYALGLWLAGSVALATFLTVRLRSLSKAEECTSKTPSLPESFYNQVSGCAGRLGLRHLPRVVATNRVTCPAVFGVWRPVLLMPHGYLERLSRRDTEHMLLHELAHIKRGDLLAHGFYMLLQIVYWYNPLLWLVRRQIHHLRELCCDATVAGLLREDTGAYRETLLETARRFLATRTEPGLGLLGLFEDSNRLLVRLNWLNKPTWRYRRMKRAIVIAIVGVMLACVLPMAHSQPTTPTEDMEATPAQPTAEQFAEQMAQLELQMQQLQQERQQLQQQMQQMTRQMAQLAQQRAQFVRDAGSDTLFQRYTVREGDTLGSIARRFSDSDDASRKETIDRIIKANELASARAIRVGQQLRIPLSEEQAERIRGQLDAAEQTVRHMSGTLADAEHTLSEAEHAVAGARTHVRAASASTTRSRVPVPGDLPLTGRLTTDVPNGEKMISLKLPERVDLAQLLVLVGQPTDLNFIYDPDVVTGEVAVKTGGPIRVGDLYLLLESALKAKGLVMERQDGNIVTIVPRNESPKTDLFHITIPESPPAPTLTDAATVDADYIVKALKPGTELRITNNVGSISIQGGAGRDCTIKVKVEAKAATPEEAEEIAKKVVVQLTPTDDRVDIGVRMPDDLSKEQRDNIHVDFDMTVPQDCVVRAIQSVGDISLVGLGDSAAQVQTNVGTIRTRDLQGKVALMVNVGDIDVVVPADASAKVRATARVGAIKSDLPLDITSASVTRAGDAQGALGSSATGVLGAGAGKLDLTTNVGSIRIRSAAAVPDDKP